MMNRWLISICMLAAALAHAGPASAKDRCFAEKIEAQIVDASGHALLCATKRGVRAWMSAKSLIPDDAFTVWWVYFDDPSKCAEPGACDAPDFGGGNPLAVFGRMDSSIAPRKGRLNFRGRIGGFRPSPGSQIWLWIFGHGPADRADGRQLARQLLTPEDPTAGAPHLGIVGGPLGFPAAVVKFDIP